jgi:integrase
MNVTLSTFLEDYRRHGQPDKAELTRYNEESKLRCFLAYVARVKDPALKDIDQALLDAYKQHRLKSIAPRSWNSELATLKAIFGWGLTRRPAYFDVNPWTGVRRVDKGMPTIKKYVAPDEIEAAACKGHPFWLNVLDFLRVSWCRASELANLRWQDVKWGAGYLEFANPKERKTKHLPLTGEVLQILKKAKEFSSGDYVFMHKGNRVSRYSVYQRVRSLGKRAGVKLSPHMLRHSGVTNALAHGAPLFAVQAVVGHSSVETTRNYDHTPLGTKQAAMEIARVTTPATKLLPPSDN